MKQANLPAMLNEMAGLMNPDMFYSRLRRLKFGWLRRQFMYLLAGQFTDEAQFRAMSERNKKRRLELDAEKFSANLNPVVDYQDCIESQSTVFGVYALTKKLRAKHAGVEFKLFNPETEMVEIRWMKLKDLSKPIDLAMRDFEQIAHKYEIPREEYHRYDFAKSARPR
jgi:hypothetical protein